MSPSDTAKAGLGTRKLTYEDYVSLPDDGLRYEILDGEMAVTPSPLIRHQIVSRNLQRILDRHVEARGLGFFLNAPVDVILANTSIVVPDLVFVSRAREGIVTERAIEGAPDLIVEILSPSTERRDRGAKLQLYARFGVPSYWIVDIDARTIDVFELGAEGYALALRAGDEAELCAAPFTDLTIRLREVWP
jgi:Uma2 family endonuclease